MKAIDMTPVIKKYAGYFVALSNDRKKILGKGHSPEEALREAREHGIKQLILTRIPEDNRSYLFEVVQTSLRKILPEFCAGSAQNSGNRSSQKANTRCSSLGGILLDRR